MSIVRKKIDNKDRWALESNGERIGIVEATYKTATQRSWDATIVLRGVVFTSTDKFSVKQAINDLEHQLEEC